MQKYILILCLACTYMFAGAQDINTTLSWQKKAKLGKEMVKASQYDKAGQYYHSAWKDNPEKLDFAYQAGENFFKAHNYKMAMQSYDAVKTMNKKFKQAGYKHALSMKRFGQYDAALVAFEAYASAENLSSAMKSDVEQHLAGCELGQQFQNDAASSKLHARHAGYTLNSDKVEFAPCPAGDNRLYFTSFSEGTAKIYASDRTGDNWSKPSAVSMRGLEKDHCGNSAFTADFGKLYFTQCDVDKQGDSQCHLYLISKNGGMWTEPVKLPKQINTREVNVTHPSVVIDGEQEYLYFASNHSGGYGGMDIWYVVKNANADVDKFSEPINLGEDINTRQDEITPYYNLAERNLFFSSNGHPNIGGFDVFKTQKRGKKWSKVENMGLPVNSSSDDMYYTQDTENSTAYLVSKRAEEGMKANAIDDDIFIIASQLSDVFVQGKIGVEGIALQDVSLSLYKKNTVGKFRKMSSEVVEGGTYRLHLDANQEYRIQVSKDGYEENVFELTTDNVDETEMTYDFDLVVEGQGGVASKKMMKKGEEVEKIAKSMSNNPLDLNTVPQKPIFSNSKTVKQTTAIDTIINPKTPVVESVPRTQENESKAEKPFSQSTIRPVVVPAVSSTEARPATTSSEYGEIYAAPIKTKEGYWVIGISPTFTEPTQAQGSYSLGGATQTTSDAYIPATSYTPPPPVVTSSTTTYTSTPAYTNSSNTSGRVYRIQISARKTYKAYRYEKVNDIGSIVLEDVDTKNGQLVRIMIDGFYSESDARRALTQVKQRGFDGAFITIYNNGVRAKRLIR